jgi:hypothetical protein
VFWNETRPYVFSTWEAKHEISAKQIEGSAYMAYSSVLKMETICSSETSIDFQRTTWRYIPEDSILHNLKSPTEYRLATRVKTIYFLEM